MTVAGQTITDERLAEIINGCEGVSPGPWSSTIMEIGSDEAIVRSAGFVVATTRIGEKPGRYGLNADHIARLDPQTVLSLLTELQHRREGDVRKKIHRLHAEYAEHRDALPIDSLDRRFAQICVELTSEILRMFPEATTPNSALRGASLMNTEQELHPDLQQRLVEALYGPGVRRSDSIEELADALIAVAAARRSSDEQAEVVGHTANCCNCGRIIDTREEGDGGDKFGAEASDGRWLCSAECWDAVFRDKGPYASPPAVAKGGVTAEMVEHAARAEYTRVILPGVMPEFRQRELDANWRFYETDARRWLTAALAVGDEGIREGRNGQA